MEMNKSNVAFVVTSFTGTSFKEFSNIHSDESLNKRHMTKTLCKHLSQSNHFVVLASHSTHDEETQSYCDLFIYDKDNTFTVDGIPKKATMPYPMEDPETRCMNSFYGVAELKSVHNAINALSRFPHITHIVKMSYDYTPEADWNLIVDHLLSHKKKLVTYDDKPLSWWQQYPEIERNRGRYPSGHLATALYLCEIEFLKQTLSLNELYRFDTEPIPWLECIWYSSIKDKNLLNEISLLDSYCNIAGQRLDQYVSTGEKDAYPYPY
jgi:hypothetical protein